MKKEKAKRKLSEKGRAAISAAAKRRWQRVRKTAKQGTQAEGRSRPAPDPVSGDREVWLRDRIMTACMMALAVNRERTVGADRPLFEYALDGIVQGAALEVITTLGLEPSFTNLRNLPTGTNQAQRR